MSSGFFPLLTASPSYYLDLVDPDMGGIVGTWDFGNLPGGMVEEAFGAGFFNANDFS